MLAFVRTQANSADVYRIMCFMNKIKCYCQEIERSCDKLQIDFTKIQSSNLPVIFLTKNFVLNLQCPEAFHSIYFHQLNQNYFWIIHSQVFHSNSKFNFFKYTIPTIFKTTFRTFTLLSVLFLRNNKKNTNLIYM